MLLQSAVALMLAFVLNYFYRQHNRSYLLLWSRSWLFLSIYLLGGALSEYLTQHFGPPAFTQHPLRILLSMVALSGGYLQVVLLLGGAYEIATGRTVSTRVLRVGIWAGILIAIVTSLAFINRPELFRERFLLRVGLRCFVTGLAFLAGAYWVSYGWTHKKGLGRRLVGISFMIYGFDQLQYSLLTFLELFYSAYIMALMMIDVLIQAVAGLGLVIWLQEEEHQQLVKSTQELRESEDRYRNVVESQTDLVGRFLPDTTLTFVNDAYCRYFGKSRDELIGRKFLELAPVTSHESIRRLIDELMSKREVLTSESEAVSADGTVRWTQWFSYAIRSANGEVLELQGVGRDISEHRQAEQSLRESEELFRSLAESVNAGIFICRKGRFIYANPPAEIMIGYGREELLSMHLWDMARPENYDEIKSKSEARDRGEKLPTRYETSLRAKSGDELYLDVTVDVISYQGDPAVLITMFDITDRKKAEDALRESETRNRALLEAIPDILFLHTKDGAYVDIYASNPLALIQRSEELLGKKIEEILPAEVAASILPQFDTAFETGEVQVCDYQLEINGEIRHFESRIVAFEEDRILRIVRDITKRMRAEKEVQKLASIIEESSEFIGLISPNGQVLYMNRAGRGFVGLGEDEDVTLRQAFDFFDEGGQKRICEEVFPSILKTGFWEGEFYLKHLMTGDMIAVQQHAFVIKEPDSDEPISFAYISHDITERRRADKLRERLRVALEKALGEWRLTFDAIEYPVLILDPERKIRRLNRAARELLDRDRKEVIGCGLEEFDQLQPWKKAAEMVTLVQENRSSFSSQLRDDSNGKMWDIAANFFVVPGVEDGVMIVARDITTLVDLQESLRRNETMAAMGALVAGVAHEVRNPLFGISATLDAFEARFGDREDHRRYTTILRTEVERLNALMRGLLEFGKPHNLVVSESAIKSLISRAVTACTSLAESAQVQIVSEVAEDLPSMLVDPQRIIQVFQNLIENAIQHSPSGGIVRVEAVIENHNDELWIDCYVSDNGPGFPQHELAQVFKPFFTRRRGGTGLGLSIVQRIVQEHGGTVTAFNEPDGGAAVKVSLKAIQ